MDKADKSRLQTSYRARSLSVMFTAHFEDGCNNYFVILGRGGADDDYLALPIARERQQTGELPEEVLRAVKRVR